MTLAAARLLEIKLSVGVGEKFFDTNSVSIVDGDANASGKPRVLGITGHDGANTVGDALGFILQGFRQDESKLIAAIARRGVDGAAVNAEDVSQPVERVAANEMAVRVVDLFEAVEVQK